MTRKASFTRGQELKARLLNRKEGANLPGRRSAWKRISSGLIGVCVAAIIMCLVYYDMAALGHCGSMVHINLVIVAVVTVVLAIIHVCFSLGPAQEKIHEYTIKNKLGDGSFGEVFHATSNETGEDVAMKFMMIEQPRKMDSVIHEALRLEVCRHENVVRLVDMFMYFKEVKMLDRILFERSPWSLCIALEYCEDDLRGTIKRWARLPSTHWPSVAQVLLLFKMIARGLNQMHSKGVAHLDLKPENIFVSKNLKIVKVGDLGLAKEASKAGAKEFRGMTGTPGYMAPEVWRWSESARNLAEGYSTRADLWSMACILVDVMAPNNKGGWSIEQEVVCHCNENGLRARLKTGDDNWPIYGDEEEGRYSFVIDVVLSIFRIKADSTISEIVRHCLEPDPEKRWNAKTLLVTLFGKDGQNSASPQRGKELDVGPAFSECILDTGLTSRQASNGSETLRASIFTVDSDKGAEMKSS